MLHQAMTKHITIGATNQTETNTISGTLTNGGTALIEPIDTIGYDYASIDVILSKMNTTSNAPTTVKLGEADITGTSNYTTITTFSGATATATNVGFLIPVTGVVTDNPNVYTFNVTKLGGRHRYLMVSATPVTTATCIVNVRLGRGEFSPTNAAAVGVQAVVWG